MSSSTTPDLEKQYSKDEPSPSPDSHSSSSSIHSLNLHVQATQEQDPAHPLPAATLVQSRIEHPTTPLHEYAFIAILCMSQLMTQAGLAISIVPLHIIGSSLGTASPAQLSWFPAAYSLTVGTFILPAGRLGDLYGHKKLFVVGFLWFGLWSIVGGFAVYAKHGIVLFNLCRALQGIGPAVLLPNSIAILGRAYKPGLKKQMVFSMFGATAPSGFVLGAVFSSLLAQRAWWPWAYWVNGIACVLFGVLGWLLIPKTPRPELVGRESGWQRADGLAAIIGVAGLVLFNFAWNQAPVVGWTDPYTYILLIVGILCLGLFAFVELRVSKFPLIPFGMISPEAGFILACIAFGWSAFGVWLFYLVQLLEELRHVSPLLVGAQLSPTAISGLCATIVTGYIIHRVPGSFVMGCALLAFTVGSILLAVMPVGQTYWAQTFVSVLVMPWGMDMSFPAANLLLSNALPKEHQGMSASLVNTFINYSISLSLGIAGTIETHVNNGGNDLLRGYRGAWYLGIGMGGAGLVTAGMYALIERRKSKGMNTDLEK